MQLKKSLLVALSTLALACTATDLGLQPDKSVVLAKQHPTQQNNVQEITQMVFTSHLKLANSGADITDGQLVQMCKDAYGGMEVSKAKRPRVMTVLHSGQDIFIASSMKGGYPYVEKECGSDSALTHAMSALVGGHPGGHVNQAMCGEIMTIALYLRQGKFESNHKMTGSRIVSVEQTKDGAVVVKRPCKQREGEDQFGCCQVVEHFDIREIPEATNAAPYTLAGIHATVQAAGRLCTKPDAGTSNGEGTSKQAAKHN
ncbi:hypothetical protein ANO11243_049730 [Dothideomycetidae sp. 11243]|nr:hypothetical protein ANO11243_049730 [fungal sp. No.11243]